MKGSAEQTDASGKVTVIGRLRGGMYAVVCGTPHTIASLEQRELVTKVEPATGHVRQGRILPLVSGDGILRGGGFSLADPRNGMLLH